MLSLAPQSACDRRAAAAPSPTLPRKQAGEGAESGFALTRAPE
jgi:hypothetical protein